MPSAMRMALQDMMTVNIRYRFLWGLLVIFISRLSDVKESRFPPDDGFALPLLSIAATTVIAGR